MNLKINYLWIILIFLLIAFFIPLSFAPLFDLDEGAFSEATREMIVRGDYITTYLNGELRFDKPILIYWLQVISVKIFGLNEFALRLPSALAGSIWAIAIYQFTKQNFNEKTAFFATIIMISSLQINMIAKAAIADSLLNLFITLTMFNLYYYYTFREKKYLYWIFVFIGLGVLTKGPVAIMIPLVVSLLFFSYKREFKLWLKMIFNPVGIIIFSLIALPWYVLEYLAQGELFIDGFFFKHNISRFNSAMEQHNGNIFYFIPVLLVGVMPFTYFIFKSLNQKFLKNDLQLFLSIWFIFVFLFFSFSSTKLPHYIIYGYTPLFILMAFFMTKEYNKKYIFLPLITFLSILLFFTEIVGFFKDNIKDQLALVLIENSHESFNLFYRLSIILLILGTILAYKKIKSSTLYLSSIALIMIIATNYIVIPTYGKLMQLPIKEAGLLAKHKQYQDIIMYKINTPSFNVYYEGIVLKTTPKIGDIVFTKVPALKDFKEYETLYKKNGFSLIKVGKI